MPIESILLIVLIAVVFLGVSRTFNTLVRMRNQVKNSFAQIDVQLKRRYDLIPNLVEGAKGYMAHERKTLEAVIAARNSASQARGIAAQDPANPQAMNALLGADNALSGNLNRFIALAESYPELKANETMGQLMEELSSTENKVSFARQAFNDSAMSYNTARETFPNNMIAAPFGFKEVQLWEITQSKEREAVKISFP